MMEVLTLLSCCRQEWTRGGIPVQAFNDALQLHHCEWPAVNGEAPHFPCYGAPTKLMARITVCKTSSCCICCPVLSMSTELIVAMLSAMAGSVGHHAVYLDLY